MAQITPPAEVPLIGDAVCAGLKSTGTDPRNCLYIGPGTNTTGVYPNEVHRACPCIRTGSTWCSAMVT